MFNFFKKQSVPLLEVVTKFYPTAVLQIHNEFDIAGDLLLQEAKKILVECEGKQTQKGLRLKALGFLKAKEVVEADNAIRQKSMAEKTAKLISYYMQKYPFNKFITEETVRTICKKYNLIMGEVGRYKGFIPESKLQEMEEFKIKKEDVPKIIFNVFDSCSSDANFIGTLDESCVTDWGKKYFANHYDHFIEETSLFTDKARVLYPDKKSKTYATKVEIKNFQICAPSVDMELLPNERIVSGKITNIPDPVVLQVVRGGYLIVAKWGDEASDELVVNEKMN